MNPCAYTLPHSQVLKAWRPSLPPESEGPERLPRGDAVNVYFDVIRQRTPAGQETGGWRPSAEMFRPCGYPPESPLLSLPELAARVRTGTRTTPGPPRFPDRRSALRTDSKTKADVLPGGRNTGIVAGRSAHPIIPAREPPLLSAPNRANLIACGLSLQIASAVGEVHGPRLLGQGGDGVSRRPVKGK